MPHVPPTPAPAWPLPGIALGCDYNPEQWPREVWAEDVALMRRAGVGFATVGVFSWSLLEPGPGRYEFGWLDEVLDLLHGAGIAADLATATASAPPWLHHRWPGTLPVDADGVRLSPGSRQSWCPSSPVYRERSLALVEQLAKRYAGHPALRMWHVSNELGCHNSRCYCDTSAEAFRGWLRRRYGGVDALNEAWSTTFWSQRYSDLAEVLPPRRTTAGPNPAHLLDFHRFSSQELLGQYRAERDVLAQLSPGVPVTTNLMVADHITGMDYWEWGGELDLVSQDHYLDHRLADPEAELVLTGDLTRGLAGERPWFLMEHSTSAVNWQPVNHAKAPGELLRTSLTHVARGADAVGFFQWRASRAGSERHHSAMLPHAGTGTRVWREVEELGRVLQRLAPLGGSTVVSDVAVLHDRVSDWALGAPSLPSTLVRPGAAAAAVHRALLRDGRTCRFVPPGERLAAALQGCRLVVVPTVYLMSPATAEALAGFVAGGGHALVTYLSGIADEQDRVLTGGFPGALRGLLGIVTEEFAPLAAGVTVGLDPLPGRDVAGTGRLWTEHTTLAGAEAVARYTGGPAAGGPAVTVHRTGAGAAWYLGTELDAADLDALVARIAADAGCARALPEAPPGVEATRRVSASGSWLCLVNRGGDAGVTVRGRDLVADRDVPGRLLLPAGGCAVVAEEA